MKGFLSVIQLIAMILVFSELVGCARASEKFDCPYGKGVGCQSITKVNQLVNDGKFEGVESDAFTSLPLISVNETNISSENAENTLQKIERVREEHLSVWLAPFQDEQGDFHEASIIHTVLKSGYWQWGKGN